MALSIPNDIYTTLFYIPTNYGLKVKKLFIIETNGPKVFRITFDYINHPVQNCNNSNIK